MTLSSQHRPFKSCIGHYAVVTDSDQCSVFLFVLLHMHNVTRQVHVVLLFFLPKGTCVVTIFDLQTCERRGQTTGCLPSFDQLKFLQLDKHKMQNLLNEKCFSDSKSPFCARNLEIYQNKPAIFAI